MKPPRLRIRHYLAPGIRYGCFFHTLAEPLLPHWHDFFELELVVEGHGTHVLNGCREHLRPGSLFLLTPADFHEIIPDSDSPPILLYNFIFMDSFLRDSINEIVFSDREQEAMATDCTDTAFDFIRQEFEFIFAEERTKTIGADLLVQGALERILVFLARCSTAKTALQRSDTGSIPKNIRRSLVYIHHHFRQTLTLAVVAERTGLSPNYFSQCFHEHVGESFQTYLQTLRVSFAARMLRSTDVPITEVCFASGFGNLSHFERTFKRHFGSTPTETRRERLCKRDDRS